MVCANSGGGETTPLPPGRAISVRRTSVVIAKADTQATTTKTPTEPVLQSRPRRDLPKPLARRYQTV